MLSFWPGYPFHGTFLDKPPSYCPKTATHLQWKPLSKAVSALTLWIFMVFILPVCLTWGPLHKSIKGPHLRTRKHSFGVFHPRKLHPTILWCMHNYLYTVVVGVLTFSFRMRHLNLLYWEEKQHTYLLTPC